MAVHSFSIQYVRSLLGIHREFVASLAFFPDGQRIFSSGQEWSDEEDNVVGKAAIWDLDGLVLASCIDVDTVASGSLSMDGQLACMATFEDLSVHETQSLQVRGRHRPAGRSAAEVHFTRDGCWLLAAGNITARDSDTVPLVVYDCRSWNEHLLMAHAPPAVSMCSSPTGRIAFGSSRQLVQVWDGANRSLIGEWHAVDAQPGAVRSPVKAIALAAEASLLVTSGELSGSVVVWDPLTGRCFRRIEHEPVVNALCSVDDGDLVLAGDSEGVITLWNVRTGERLADAVTGNGLKFDISLSTGEHSTTPVEQAQVSYLAVSPDRRLLLAGDWTGAIHLYEIHGLG